MATQVQFRRGTTAQSNSFTGASGEININTDKNTIRVHNGSTQGGFELARADLTNISNVGVLTATTFDGDLTGNVTGNLTGTATTTTNIPNLSGDITSTNTTTTLATVNSNIGTFGSGSSIPTITVNGKGLITAVSTTAVDPANDGTLTLATSGTGLSGSATFTANQSGNSTFTVTSNATSNNTNSTIVARDASGNFSAGTITASLNGNAGTATSLSTARAIALSGDVSGSANFDGSAGITITTTIADDSHNHVISNVDGLQTALDLKAPLASPALSGTPTAPTAAAGTNTTQVATTAFVSTAVANLVDTAPAALDTLNELAAALGDDPNFATTVSTSIGTKLDASSYTASDVLTKIKTVDGASSGLDADLLDGQEGSYYRNASNINAGTIGDAYLPATISSDITGNAATATNSTNSSNVAITDNTATNATYYVHFGSATTGNDGVEVDSTGLTYNPSSNTLTTGTFSGALSGNSSTATKLATARTIALSGDVTGSVSFDGSADATISATIAANSVALGTDTTGNYVASITNGSYITGGNGGSEGAGLTLAVDATTTNTASKVVARDASGNFSAGTITASLSGNATSATTATTAGSCSGNAATATTLQTARTINGVSFNGSANIVVEPYIEDDASTDANRFITFVDSSTAGYQRLNEDADFYYNPSTNTCSAGNFNSTSDVNLKKDIDVIDDAHEILNQIRGVRFAWKVNDRKSAGVIAQDVEKVLPELVDTSDNGNKTVNYQGLIGVLIEAVKDQQKQINALKEEIELLK